MGDVLVMSQFLSKEDFLRAKTDLARQSSEVTKLTATPFQTVITRLICGVELKMKQRGKHWNLEVRKV